MRSPYSLKHTDVPHSYNNKVHPHIPKLQELLVGLRERAGLTPIVVVVPQPHHPDDRGGWDAAWFAFDKFVKAGRERKLGRTPDGEIEWARLGFDWPLWILFSSGTTGTRSPGACFRSRQQLIYVAPTMYQAGQSKAWSDYYTCAAW